MMSATVMARSRPVAASTTVAPALMLEMPWDTAAGITARPAMRATRVSATTTMTEFVTRLSLLRT